MAVPDRERETSRAFVELADTLVAGYDVLDLLTTLAGHAVSLLAADAAGILLGDARRELAVAAASSGDVRTMELLALQAGEGPCLDCFSTAAPVSVPDITTSPEAIGRWPAFVAAVLRDGTYRSVHALPLRLRGQAIGAMSLFHPDPGPLPPPDLALGQALADVATIGILSERTVHDRTVLSEQLQTALDSRVVIEQAKGVIAQSLGISTDEAFDRLPRFSRDHNLRLAAVARELAAGTVAVTVLDATPARRASRGRSPG